MFKNINKLYPEEKLFSGPLSNNDGIVSYDDDIVYSEPYEDWYEKDQKEESVEIDEINGKCSAGYYIGDEAYKSLGALILPYLYNYVFNYLFQLFF